MTTVINKILYRIMCAIAAHLDRANDADKTAYASGKEQSLALWAAYPGVPYPAARDAMNR